MTRLVNKAQLADVLGISLPTLSNWVRAGLPVVSRGRKGLTWEFDLAACLAWTRQRDIALAAQLPEDATMAEAELRYKRAQASIQEIELAEKQRQVVPVKDASAMVADRVTTVRQRLRGTGGRLALRLVGVQDVRAIRETIEQDIALSLRELSEDTYFNVANK